MDHPDVLVVGAGPAGLATGCLLQQEGVSVRVIDAAEAGTGNSRAAVLHARTLEALDRIGATAALLREGLVVPQFTVRDAGSILARLDFSRLPTPYPFTLMLPQSRTEALLEARLREAGGAVERRTALHSLSSQGTERRAVILHADGLREEIAPRFIVGADGARSLVRSQVGIPFPGDEYEQAFILADVVLRWSLPDAEVQLFLAADGLVVVAPLPGGHHRIVATMDDAPARPGIGDIQAVLDARGPGAATVEAVAWSSRFRVAHRLASRYRDGGVPIVGDAAHVHSPAGGQGMNVGIQDALDLADALTAVILRGAPEASLDGYGRRRRPLARRVIRLTDLMTRMAAVKGTAPRWMRDTALRTILRSGRVRDLLASDLAGLR